MPSPLDHGDPYYFIVKKEKPDGYGGSHEYWGEGEEFIALIDHSTSSPARIAEAFGSTSTYQVSVDKDLNINVGDLFAEWQPYPDDPTRGQYFGYRVTSRPEDQKAPDDSILDFKVFSAENYNLPESLTGFRDSVEVVDGHLNVPKR